MRVIVTGWRHAGQEHTRVVADALSDLDLSRYPEPDVLVHCDADEFDRLAADVAAALGWAVEAHPANWTAALQLGGDLVLAFPGPLDDDAWDRARLPAAHGIPVCVYPLARPKAGA